MRAGSLSFLSSCKIATSLLPEGFRCRVFIKQKFIVCGWFMQEINDVLIFFIVLNNNNEVGIHTHIHRHPVENEMQNNACMPLPANIERKLNSGAISCMRGTVTYRSFKLYFNPVRKVLLCPAHK